MIKPISPEQQEVLDRMAKRQQDGDESAIDYSDIPALTDEQLAGMVQPLRALPKLGTGKEKVAIVDPKWARPMTDDEVDAFVDGS